MTFQLLKWGEVSSWRKTFQLRWGELTSASWEKSWRASPRWRTGHWMTPSPISTTSLPSLNNFECWIIFLIISNVERFSWLFRISNNFPDYFECWIISNVGPFIWIKKSSLDILFYLKYFIQVRKFVSSS